MSKDLFYGFGLNSKGRYKTKIKGKHTKSYQSWRDMIRRCYDPTTVRYHAYGGRGVTVTSSWRDYQEFAKWYESISTFQGIKYVLDKDFCGGRIYSPNTCLLLPYYLNASIVDTYKRTGKGYSVEGCSRKRYNISTLGRQHQLPDYNGADSEEYQLFFKVEVLKIIVKLSRILGHIGNYEVESINKYIDSITYKKPTDKMKNFMDKLPLKILKDTNTAVKLGIDNGVEIINLYHEEQRKRVEAWIIK